MCPLVRCNDAPLCSSSSRARPFWPPLAFWHDDIMTDQERKSSASQSSLHLSPVHLSPVHLVPSVLILSVCCFFGACFKKCVSCITYSKLTQISWMKVTVYASVFVFVCIREVWVSSWVNKLAANNLPTDRKSHLPIILSLPPSLCLSLHPPLTDYAVNTVRMRGADNWPAWINIS